MAAVTKLLVNHNLKRCICTGQVNHGSYPRRQGRFMNKLMGEGSSKRKWYPSKAQTFENPAVTHKITSNHITRRMSVLNKLFMQHITDLMATGEAATELVGRKIQITHVKVTPDFQKVLVFWASKKPGQETETAELLKDCAFRLRHELTQLRVIGQVPMLQFVKNKKLEGLCELEKRFTTAEYGEDFEPTMPPVAPKRELTLTKNLLPEVRKKILEMQDCVKEEEADDSKYDVKLPPMRRDVLGLDHNAVMNRILQSLKKAREGTRNRLLNVTSIYPTGTAEQFDVNNFETAKLESQAFMEFLWKRQLEEKRKNRRQNKDDVLAYNMRTHEVSDFQENEPLDEERDVDDFEDADLESFK